MYKKVTKDEINAFIPKNCGVSGCANGAYLVLTTKRGIQVVICNKHYMLDVDRYRKGAMSEKWIEGMEVEMQKQKEMGKEQYKEQALGMMGRFLRALR